MIQNPTALILCGGRGERLKPLTNITQKCMLPVFGIPFMEYIINQIKQMGIKDIVLCCGYKGDQVINYFDSGYKYSYSHPITNTGARLKLALPIVNSENVAVFNGDSYCTITKDLFWESYKLFIESNTNLAKLFVSKTNSLLASFISNKIDDYYGAGIYFFKKSFLDSFSYVTDLSIEDDLIIDNDCLFIKLPVDVGVMDIGTHTNYKEVNDEGSRYGRFLKDLWKEIS
jgi:mannose-1-phosphate guanylyltransferase